MATIVTGGQTGEVEWLREALAAGYGLDVSSCAPLAEGYTARCYLVVSREARYVAKVWRAEPPGEAWARLTEELHRRGLRVPYPIRTRAGEAILARPGGTLCLLPYIEGSTPKGWPDWPVAVLEALGAFLAALHAAPPALARPIDLASPVGDLSYVDSALATEFRHQCDRLEALRGAADLDVARWVVCHTDAGGDNLRVDVHGELGVLDWDEAALAPPECDFVLAARDQGAAGSTLRHILRGYGAELDPARLSYFMLRRYVGDAAVRLGELARPEADRAALLAGIHEWGVRPWRRLESLDA